MRTKLLKCVNCNVVISEILAFIRSRHDVMDSESLIRLCESAFSEEDIEEAKVLLFNSTKTDKKLISRRKEKKKKDLEDIISVFKTTDPDQLPTNLGQRGRRRKTPWPHSADITDTEPTYRSLVYSRTLHDSPPAKTGSPAPVNSTILENTVLSQSVSVPADTANKNNLTMAGNTKEWRME
ncbi:hypothetical protein ACJJTC_000402 [Scirpophaga incertulas]